MASIPTAPGPGKAPTPTAMGRAAALHGTELLRLGYTIDQVVHEYGDICQAVTELASEQKAPVTVAEFHTLNRCLDNAIADAVTAFARGSRDSFDQADELQNLVDIAMQAFSAIKTGNIGVTGATGTLLIRTLSELRLLTDWSLPEVRRASGTIARRDH